MGVIEWKDGRQWSWLALRWVLVLGGVAPYDDLECGMRPNPAIKRINQVTAAQRTEKKSECLV